MNHAKSIKYFLTAALPRGDLSFHVDEWPVTSLHPSLVVFTLLPTIRKLYLYQYI